MNLAPPIDAAADGRHAARRTYLRVWAALAVFTAVEYVYASYFRDLYGVLVIGLLFWAGIKAGLVGWFFMHMRDEGAWVYLLIVPACLLAVILVLALYPDQAWKPEAEENPMGISSTRGVGAFSVAPLLAGVKKLSTYEFVARHEVVSKPC